MSEDLDANCTVDKKNKQHYIEMLKGLPAFNCRARANDDLSPEEQVRCLIDLATDRYILGNMFKGWKPWI